MNKWMIWGYHDFWKHPNGALFFVGENIQKWRLKFCIKFARAGLNQQQDDDDDDDDDDDLGCPPAQYCNSHHQDDIIFLGSGIPT